MDIIALRATFTIRRHVSIAEGKNKRKGDKLRFVTVLPIGAKLGISEVDGRGGRRR